MASRSIINDSAFRQSRERRFWKNVDNHHYRKLHSECNTMKRAVFLAATLLAALTPVIALAAAVQSNLAITVTSPPPPSPGLLPADRDASANWQIAGMLSVGGIPNRTTVCAMVNPRGSGQDDTAKIQSAVDACPPGQVVSLAAGTFTVAEGNYVALNKGITIRGAGAGSTIIQRTGGASIGVKNGSTASPHIIVGPMRWNNNLATNTNLTADGAQSSYSVQVQSATGFSVGQIVLLDEASGLGWQPDWVYGGSVWAESDYRLVWRAHSPTCQSGDRNCSGGSTPPSIPCYFGPECDRYTSELKRIASISGNTITFDSPITISYRVSHRAHLANFQTAFTTNAGVENLTLQSGDNSNLEFIWCAYCWAKNVESTIHSDGGIWVVTSFRVQLEGIYDHKGAWPYTGGAGYNFVFDQASSEFLLQNSISILNDKVMVVREAGAGSVVAYNYFDMGFCSDCGGAWIESGANASHWLGSHHVLFEGNWTFNTDGDDTWGADPYMTWYRNYASGYRSRFNDYVNNNAVVDDINNIPGGNAPLRAASLGFYNYWHSFVGNVLGTPGHTSGWSYTSYQCGGKAIFNLGYACAGGMGDPEILSHQPSAIGCVSETADKCPAIRHGNYDYLNNAVVWDSNISNHTLPNSFYLPGKPAFFNDGSGYAWPWVDPTGAPQLYTLPAKARYDAGTPFTQP